MYSNLRTGEIRSGWYGRRKVVASFVVLVVFLWASYVALHRSNIEPTSEYEVENDDGFSKDAPLPPEPFELQSRIEMGTTPFVVGGIGDSGTRGAWEMLTHLGVDMMPDDYVKTDTKDSILFMNKNAKDAQWKDSERRAGNRRKAKILTTNPDGVVPFEPPAELKEFHRKERTTNKKTDVFYGPGWTYLPYLWRSGDSADQNVKRSGSIVSSEVWDENEHRLQVDAMRGIVENHRHVHRTRDPENGHRTAWGFKHPRTALVLPFLQEATQGKIKYVHVIRDGRDLAFSKNDKMYEGLCCLLYHQTPNKNCLSSGTGSRCEVHDTRAETLGKHRGSKKLVDDSLVRPGLSHWHAMRLQFWQDTNYQILRYGVESLGVMEGYFPLRIEDFVLEMDDVRDGCFSLFLEFLNHPLRGVRLSDPATVAGRDAYGKLYHEIRSLFRGHRRPYGGTKAGGVANQREVIRALYRGDPKSHVEDYFGLPLFGYHVHKWGIDLECEEWISKLRTDGIKRLDQYARVNATNNEVYAFGRRDWRSRHSPV